MATNTIARTIIRSVARDLYFPKFSRPISVLSSIISKPSHFFVSSSFSRPTPSPAVVVTFPSHRFLYSVTRPHRSGVWSPPQRVFNFQALWRQNQDALLLGDLAPRSDKHHWLVCCSNDGVGFATEQELFHFYIQSLAEVVGSEEEAKKKIYLVSCALPFGFGAEIDEDAQNKLLDFAYEDCCYGARSKDPSPGSTTQFTPFNWNCRLDNIFSYHLLSKQNPEWNFDHWLINIKEPDGGFGVGIFEFIIKMVVEVIGGSEEEEEVMKKIYIIWERLPYGFGVEIDEETSNKFKDLPCVLKVLPDYAFDVKEEFGESELSMSLIIMCCIVNACLLWFTPHFEAPYRGMEHSTQKLLY